MRGVLRGSPGEEVMAIRLKNRVRKETEGRREKKQMRAIVIINLQCLLSEAGGGDKGEDGS